MGRVRAALTLAALACASGGGGAVADSSVPRARRASFPLDRDARLDPGCFAWSPSLRAVACVAGESDLGGRGDDWKVVFVGADVAPIRLGEPVRSHLSGESARFRLSRAQRVQLLSALADGDFHPLPLDGPTREVARRGRPVTVGGVAVRIDRDGAGARCRGDDVGLRTPALPRSQDPTLTVRRIPGARLLIVEARDWFDLEGEYGYGLAATLIDPDRCRGFE
jgi:hypothetical protein